MSVSVVIPAYNAERFLAECVESVLAQTASPDEILVVDDGSTDRTAEIARSYGGIVRCISQNNRGLAEARNSGIREAQGDFVALLDSDDTWLPGKLEAQLPLVTSPNVVACFTEREYFNSRGPVPHRNVKPRLSALVEHLLLESCVVGSSSDALIRRSVLEQIGLFDRRFSQCADWDMWIRLAGAGEIRVVERSLARIRLHDTNMSRDIRLLERDTFAVLDKFFSENSDPRFQGIKRHVYSNHWMIVSGSYLHAGQWLQSLRSLMNAIVQYPGNGLRAAGAPVRWIRRRMRASA